MIIHIVGGGPDELLPDLSLYNSNECIWVGVDRGVKTLLNHGMVPFISFGDFDSIDTVEFEKISHEMANIQIFQPEKDETDMELAINWALDQQPTTIRIFAGTGGRLDHFLANIQLVLKPILKNINCMIEIIDRQNIVYAVQAGSHQLHKMDEKKYISFIPITPSVEGLTLQGFKYPLKDCHIPLGSTLCISNELITQFGTFSFVRGILLVIRSSDHF